MAKKKKKPKRRKRSGNTLAMLQASKRNTSSLISAADRITTNLVFQDEPKLVLDLGCGEVGTIRSLAVAARRHEGVRIFGLDRDKDVLDIITGLFPDVINPLPVDFGDPFPLGDESVDVVLMAMAFFYCNDTTMRNAIEESHRVLRPDGRTILQVNPYPMERLVLARKLLGRTPDPGKPVYVAHGQDGIAGFYHRADGEYDRAFVAGGFRKSETTSYHLPDDADLLKQLNGRESRAIKAGMHYLEYITWVKA